MLLKRVIFAANRSTTSGVGHLRRLIEITKAPHSSIEKHFIGLIDVPWIRTLATGLFLPSKFIENYGVASIQALSVFSPETYEYNLGNLKTLSFDQNTRQVLYR